jgi:hypothetical protein
MFNCNAQLSADAGPNKVICQSWYGIDTITLGGNPTASGGVPPYTYSWETSYTHTIGQNTFTNVASQFMSDTTQSNPNVYLPRQNPVTFYLTVTDSEGNFESDSVIMYSSFFGTHLAYYDYHIPIGDSIYFNHTPNVLGGIQPYTDVIWRPNEGLIDSTNYNGVWIKPTTNQIYYVTVTDSAGCTVSGGGLIYVYVGVANIQEETNDLQLIPYPNPNNGLFKINNYSLYDQMGVFDSKGQLVKQKEVTSEIIDLKDLKSGTYSLVFSGTTKNSFVSVTINSQ